MPLGKIDKNNLTVKNKVTSGNTIVLQSHRDINSSLDFERQETNNSNISIQGKRNIFYEQNIELLDNNSHNRSIKNNRTKQDNVPTLYPTVNILINVIDVRQDQYTSNKSELPIKINTKIIPIPLYNHNPITVHQQNVRYYETTIRNFPAINILKKLIYLIMRQNLEELKTIIRYILASNHIFSTEYILPYYQNNALHHS